MTEFLTALAEQYPERTFARFNHAGDDVQEAFYEAVGGRAGRVPAAAAARPRLS